MPNWISGCAKIRGRFDDVKRFFEVGIEKATISDTINDGYIEIEIPGEADGYIDGTRRAFCATDHNVYLDKPDDDNKKIVVAFPVEQAWDFTKENWMAISTKYNVDIRLYGIECGMQFVHELEVIAGVVVKDSVTEWHDPNEWRWGCPLPYMGG